MRPNFRNVASTLSLLIGAATVLLWMRSYRLGDSFLCTLDSGGRKVFLDLTVNRGNVAFIVSGAKESALQLDGRTPSILNHLTGVPARSHWPFDERPSWKAGGFGWVWLHDDATGYRISAVSVPAWLTALLALLPAGLLFRPASRFQCRSYAMI